MEEAEWLASHDPVEMLESMPNQASARRLRLFACACCRHFEDALTAEQFMETVKTAEAFADGQTTKAALKRARQGVRKVRHELPDARDHHIEWVALWLAEVTASENAFGQVAHEIRQFVSDGLIKPDDQPPGDSLLRCIIGNPFRAVSINRQWRTSKVTTRAHGIYDEHKFDRLPQLAKELKEAGCTDKDVLKHCRSKGPHVRGCWVVDQLIGES